jgi:hypothetical protein
MPQYLQQNIELKLLIRIILNMIKLHFKHFCRRRKSFSLIILILVELWNFKMLELDSELARQEFLLMGSMQAVRHLQGVRHDGADYAITLCTMRMKLHVLPLFKSLKI